VRCGPKGVDDGGATKLIEGAKSMAWWREDGTAVVVRSAGADTRSKKERRG
jgi:hypothetical protein